MTGNIGISDSVSVAAPPASITHQHILSIVNTERPGNRILDVGCGGGGLTRYLAAELTRLTGNEPQVHGLDVTGVGFDNTPGFFGADVTLIGAGDPWPFSPDYFDCVVSNQVLEHVKDLDFLFSQIALSLRPGGISVHVFPLKNVFWEAHVRQPLAHRITNHDFAVSWSRFWSRLGIGDRMARGLTHNQFGEDAADSLLYYCFYRSYREIILAAKNAGLRPSLRYSVDYYVAKLRAVLGLAPRFCYRRRLCETPLARLLSHMASVTLFLEKTNVHK